MKKALILAPAVAIMAACGGDDADSGLAGDTLGIGATPPATYTDPAVGGTGTMGDTMGMMMGDTMGMMGADTMGMGTGTTPP